MYNQDLSQWLNFRDGMSQNTDEMFNNEKYLIRKQIYRRKNEET